MHLVNIMTNLNPYVSVNIDLCILFTLFHLKCDIIYLVANALFVRNTWEE